MSSQNSRLRKRPLYRKLTTKRSSPPPVALGHPPDETDWGIVEIVLGSIQSPKPLDPEWIAEMGPGWDKQCVHAMKVLLQVQLDQAAVPDEVWETIDPTSRAGFLRNTLAGCLAHHRRLTDALAGRSPP